MTVIDARPVALALSRTATVAVRGPLSAADVVQGSEMGPLLVVEVLVITVPLTLSVTVLEPAAAFSSQTVNQTVPATVAPLAGAVMITLIVSPPPAGPMVNVCGPDVCPSGLRTLTAAEPAAAMSDAGMLAVRRVALTKVVVRAAPFQSTVAPETKLAPSAVSVKAGPPAVAVFGVSVVRLGGGGVMPVQLTCATASPPRS